ncbi:MAG: NUDIX domain-containing protein [Pseudomonadota bacterium]
MAREPDWRYCPRCGSPLAAIAQAEDGGDKVRLRCAGCGFTHWNNPPPVLAAVIERVDCDPDAGRILLARNAAWTGRLFALITGFMEAGETAQQGIEREVAEETSLAVDRLSLIGVYDFQRMNQVIIAYHAECRGEVRLSPELAEYKMFTPETVRCWPAGTGHALADWLRSRGHTPRYVDLPPRT